MTRAAALALCAVLPAAAICDPSAAGLRVNGLVDPGDVTRPCFTWRMDDSRPGARQTAYRIVVRGRGLAGCAWDSGWVESAESANIPYCGVRLGVQRAYTWEVSLRNAFGETLPPARAMFGTGLPSSADWGKAAWISPPGEGTPYANAAVFRRTVSNARRVREAWLTVASLGAYTASINGEALPEFLKGGFTQPETTRHSTTFEVTRLWKADPGAVNTLSATVAPSWWRCQLMRRTYPPPKTYPESDVRHPKNSALKAVLTLRYDDGTEERVATDPSWVSAYTGPVVTAGIFEGEVYDARRREGGFVPSVTNTDFRGEVRSRPGAAVRLREDLALAPKALSVLRGVEGDDGSRFGRACVVRRPDQSKPVAVSPGETLLVDFGQNCAAVPRIEIDAPNGAVVRMRFSEMLNDGYGEKSRGNDGPGGTPYLSNLRGIEASVTYVSCGGWQKYVPSFTFFGYRYMSVSVSAPVTLAKVESVPVSSVAAEDESPVVETGDERVNRLAQNVRWGFRSNYLAVPTDCPQRNERLGWTADTRAFLSAACWSADVRAFIAKWLADLRDCQPENGAFGSYAPQVWGAGFGAVGCWGDAGVLVPHALYRRYGDAALVREHWSAMVRHMDFLEAHGGPDKHYYGDWQAFEHACRRPDRPYLCQEEPYKECFSRFFYVWDCVAMRELAAAIGEPVERWESLERKARDGFRRDYVGPDGLLLEHLRGQGSDLFALKLGLVEGEAARRTLEHLKGDIAAHGDCLQTGFHGTSIFLETLSELGEDALAYTLLLQRKNPSWLYSVDQGATTVWERWDAYRRDVGFNDPGMNSFNHYAYGAVYSWMVSVMCGIREDPAKPGMRRFVFAPRPDRRVGFAKGAYDSVYGRISSEWKYAADGALEWRFSVPANTIATVRPPDGSRPVEYGPGSYTLRFAPGAAEGDGK